MPYTKPTLSQLITAINADLFSRFPSLDASLANSFANNLAEVIAGGNAGLYGYLDWIARQGFPDTSESEFLERWASIIGFARRAAARADGTATFTGTVGSSVAADAELVSSAGVVYTVDTGFTLAATSEDHEITAKLAGADGNLDAGAELSFVSVPSGIDETATVDGDAITGGLDLETDTSFRTRFLTAFRAASKGGAPTDYDIWAREATGVTRTFVFTANDPGLESVSNGEVLLYFAMDDDYDDGIPAAGDVTDVQDYVEGVMPAAASFTADAPVADTVDFGITITPNTTLNQGLVEAELKEKIIAKGGVGTTLTLYDIYEAMSAVPNLDTWSVDTIDGAAPAGVTTAAGELHTLGTVTFS